MTREEFVARQRQLKGAERKASAFQLAMVLLLLLLLFAFERFYPRPPMWLFLTVLFGIPVAGLWVPAWRARAVAASLGLQCGACGVRLVGALGQVAVGSGRCGQCGAIACT
jgi:protein-S-isoprenylcysteine O-methyltransferase Ste14